jgi:hypothetical protein
MLAGRPGAGLVVSAWAGAAAARWFVAGRWPAAWHWGEECGGYGLFWEDLAATYSPAS